MAQPGESSEHSNPGQQLALLLEQLANQPGISQKVIDEAAEQDQELGEQLNAARKTIDLLHRVREYDSQNVRSTIVNMNTVTIDPNEVDIRAFDDAFEVDVEKPIIETLGRFEIKRQLGEGGFGIVLLAYDPKLKRQVAIKIPRPQAIMTEDLRRRFINEAEAAAALNHPNIIPVYETGNIESTAYIASQYCDGPTLEQWLESNKAPTGKDAARLAIALAEAIQHAHNRKVLHRDLKPQNILLDLAELDAKANVADHFATIARITDFGLAKVQTTDDELTRTGSIIGTPAYIAPELAAGESTGSPAADIYAIGAVLYRVLSGVPPFKESTPIKTLRAVQEKEPSSIRSKNPVVDRDLESICLKCLEKNPANRYENAMALAEDLNRYVEGLAVKARPIGSLQKFSRWCRRNPVVAGAVAVVCATLIVSLAVVTTMWQISERNRIKANQNKVVAQKETEQTRQAVFRLFTRVSEHPELKAHGMAGVRRAILNEANQFYSDFLTDLPDDAKQLGEHIYTLYALAQINFELGNRSEAEKYVQLGLDLLEERGSELPDLENKLAFFQSYQARLMREAGNVEGAQAQFEQAIGMLKDAINNNPSDELKVAYARTLGEYANQVGVSDVAKSQTLVSQALGVWDELGCLPPHRSANDEIVAALFLTKAANHEMRRQVTPMQRAATTGRDILLPLVEGHPDVPSFMDKLAECYRMLGLSYSLNSQGDMAMENYLLAVDQYSRLSEIHTDIPRYVRRAASIQYSIAFIQFKNRDYESAEKTLSTNIEIVTEAAKRFPEMKIGFLQSKAFSLQLLFGVYSDLDLEEKRLNALQQACDQFVELMAMQPGSISVNIGAGNSMVMLGNVKRYGGDLEGAFSSYDAAIAILNRIVDRDSRIAEARLHLCSAYMGKSATYRLQERWLLSNEFSEQALKFDDGNRYRMTILSDSIEGLTHLQKYDVALKRAALIKGMPSGSRDAIWHAANQVASGIDVINGQAELDDEQREQRIESYVNACIELLKRANEIEPFKDDEAGVQQLTDGEEFQSIHSHPDFKAFVEQLRD